MADHLLQESGFRVTLEDGSGFLLLESGNRADVSATDVGIGGVSASDSRRGGVSSSDSGIGNVTASDSL